MIDTYRQGKTPNPDIYCNRYIKFDIFLERALELGADYIATGHYVRHIVRQEKDFLLRGKDKNKDQSYFLSQIKKGNLKKVIFPLGKMEKSQVRKLAKKYNLFTADKKDSQGICFIQKKINLKDFLKNYIPEKKGKIFNMDNQEIGEHDGTVFYTIGQRHGFKIFPEHKTPNQKRLFIVKKDFKQNILWVGNKEELKDSRNSYKKIIEIKNFNFLVDNFEKYKNLMGQVRHLGNVFEIEKYEIKNKKITFYFGEPVNAVAEGQFLSIYSKDICLGSGEII